MIHWFTKNHVAANILMLGILILGSWMAVEKIGIEVEPGFTIKRVEVRVKLPGATPEDVEKQIILPVEKALEDLPGKKLITSTARNGYASISIEAEKNTNIDDLKIEIESRIQRVNTFPQESEKPRVYVPDTSNWREVITIAVSADVSDTILLDATRKVRNELTAKAGISKIKLDGDKDKEISIDLIPEKLNAFNLTFDDVARGIRNSSIDLSAGSIRQNGERVNIRANNKAYTGEQFRKLPIKKVNSSVILLEHVADIKDSFVESPKETLFNGKKALLIDVMRKQNENALDIADIVHTYVTEASKTLPPGFELGIWDDDSVSLRGRIRTLTVNLIQGGILVMIVLGLFLRPSVAFWVTVGIPVSFAGAAICMYFLGVTINNMSLFGFIIVLGIVVDDAIVTGESIFNKAKSGKYSQIDAAVLGTKEVAVPVTFGIITTMAAFIPLMLGDDYFANMKRQIPFVVIPVLVFSLIESKLILPAHLKHLKLSDEKKNILTRIQDFISDSLNTFIKYVFQPVLKFAVKFRYAIICAFIAILAITISYYQTQMQFKVMPSIERYAITAKLRMKEGTDIEITKARIAEIAQHIEDLKSEFVDQETGESLIRHILTVSGGNRKWGADNEAIGSVMVELVPPSQRSSTEVKNSDIVSAWNDRVGEIDGAAMFHIKGETTRGKHHQGQDGLAIQLSGNDEEAKANVAEMFEQWIKQSDSLKSPYSSERNGTRELQIRPKAAGSQLTDQSLAKQVKTAFYGTRIDKIQRGEDEINVMLRFPEQTRKSIHTLDTLRISLPNNTTAPLTQFADIIETETPPVIERENGSRIMHLNAKAENGYDLIELEPEITAAMNNIIAMNSSVSWKYLGVLEEHGKQQKEFYTQIIGLALVLFALLAIPFKSFLQPFYVLLAVPFGIVGAIWGHQIMGMDITSLSLLGVLALAGVVVNDSLVLVDYINQKRLERVPLIEAVIEAGMRRFRPIILTSITTFAGLMPLLYENSIQAQFLIPMAVSLGFGILFATFITLLLIPCFYMVGEEIKSYLARFLKWFFMRSDKTT